MTNTEDEQLNAYLEQAGSWAEDRQKAIDTSRRTAWIIAGVACAVAVLEAIALAALSPLKTVEPYTLLVDRQTGFVQALKPLEAQVASSDGALTQSFLVQYVIAREGFDYTSLQNDYRKVGLWSAGAARASYLANMQASNADSPLNRYPRSAIVGVEVKSVTSLGRDSAMVRFDTRLQEGGGQVRPAQAWVSVVRYRYSGEPMAVADRFVNPLGFQVIRYRRSAEVLAPTERASLTPAQPSIPQIAGQPVDQPTPGQALRDQNRQPSQ